MTPFLLIAALLVLFSTNVQCGTNLSCLATEDGWFYISQGTYNKDDATTHCQKLGGKLAILDSEEKSEAVNKLIKQRDGGLSKDNPRRYLIGALEAIALTEKKFYWEDKRNAELKKPCSYVNWCPGQPDSVSDRCVVIEYKDGDYCWSDISCWKNSYYVCEY